MCGEIEVSYYCPYCETDTSLVILINSLSDYYIVDECCPNCDANIDQGIADKLASDAVSDYYATQGDFSYDMMRDRELGL